MKMRVRKNISNDDPTTSFSATKIADARRVIGYSGRNCGIARGGNAGKHFRFRGIFSRI